MEEKPKKHTHVFLVVVIVLLVVWNVQQLFKISELENKISRLEFVAKEYEDFASNLYATTIPTGNEGGTFSFYFRCLLSQEFYKRRK